MKTLNSVIVFLFLFQILGCAQQADENNMSVQQLKEEMNANENLIILDVRTPAELEGPLGKIDGVINIPVQELENRLGELEEYKSNEIAVICRTGNRSGVATKILLQNGFKAKNVLGGMTEYINQK
ncbi:MAG: rhodanese-like domain-containing protein [Ignavibacteriales bacterium]|nr:rhodanese-like domain-containing protein [Ignavibacteriales bacterium]